MIRFLVRRVVYLLITLFITSVLIFAIVQVLPGDVARVLLGREAGEAAVNTLREELGLNAPLPTRYLTWVGSFAQGDWGLSYANNKRPVYPLVMGRLRNSLWLAGVALLIAVIPGVLLGLLAGLNAERPADAVISVGSLGLVGLPEFVTGVVLINVLAYQWEWFPPTSEAITPAMNFGQALPYLILPALTAAGVMLAYIVRLTRAGVIEVLRQSYIRTATLKGIPRRRVVFQHVLRNAMLPTITVIAISLGWLISGLVVIENVFGFPGIGALLSFAIMRRDLFLMQAIAMVAVFFYTLANFAADVLYAYFNPRIRQGRR